MKQELKIVIGYAVLLVLLGAAAFLFPHREFDTVGVVNVSLQLLLAFLSILIMKNSDDASQQGIFFFSSLLFGSGLLLLLSLFAGSSFLKGSTYGPFLYYLYVNKAGLALVSSLAVLSVAVDYVFHRFSAMRKLLLTLVLAGTLVYSLFSSFVVHPFNLFKEWDYLVLYGMTQAQSTLQPGNVARLSDADLAATISRQAPKTSPLSVARTNSEELTADVGRLREYLQGDGLTKVFWRPLDLALIYLRVALLAVIALLLAMFYRTNAHLGAYVDKILILFFLFFSMEIFHTAGFLLTSNPEAFHTVFRVGQYFTIFCLLLMVYAYDLKLRFVLSVAGKYYEFAVQRTPEKVTRWRDELDQLILRAFLKRNHGYNKLGTFSQTED